MRPHADPAPAAAMLAEEAEVGSAARKRTFLACCGGIALDGMDNQANALIVPALIATWHIGRPEAGLLQTTTLLAASAGGWVAGALSDRLGRVALLKVSILWFSFFSLLSAFAADLLQLQLLRALYALGFGGEMAVSIALVGEIAGNRRRATMLGTMHGMFSVGSVLASLLFALCFSLASPALAWRLLLGLGALPALLVLYIRRAVPNDMGARRDPAARPGSAFRIFREGRLRQTLLGAAIASGTLAGVAGVQAWLPTYLTQTRHLSILNTTSNLVLFQLSHFLGYIVGGRLADRFGRRPSFLLSSACSLLSVLAYMLLPLQPGSALLLAVPLGFFTATIYGAMAALFTEIFPAEIRGSGVAFCYNSGRAVGAFAPAIIGYLSAITTLAQAIGLVVGIIYGTAILAGLLAPETKGRALLPSTRIAHGFDA